MNPKKYIRLLAILLMTSCFPSQIEGQAVHQRNENGVRAMDAGDYGTAVEHFRFAYGEYPANDTIRHNYIQALNALGVEKGEMGEYRAALKILVKAYEMDMANALVCGNLVALAMNQATKCMAQKEYVRADTKYRDAYHWASSDRKAEIDRARGENYFRWGMEKKQGGELRNAAGIFEDSLKITPDHLGSLVELGELYYNQGEHLEALANLMLAHEINPDLPGLAELMGKVEREGLVEQDFSSHSSRNFHITYEGEIQEISVRMVMKILKQAYRQLGGELDYHPQRKIPVVLYSGIQYQRAIVAPHWAGAFYDGKIRLPVSLENPKDENNKLTLTIRHEYTHALIHQLAVKPVPAWINEGLAGYLELDHSHRRQRHEEDGHELRLLLTEDDLPVISRLPPEFVKIEGNEEVYLAYLVSRHFVGWLIHEYQVSRLTAALGKVDGGSMLHEAVEDIYGQGIDMLELQWWDDMHTQ